MMSAPESPGGAPLSPAVKALGVVSLFTDLSSEMVYPLNAVFLTRVLGAPPEIVGLIEGIAESAASVLKLWSGWFSDRIGRRKPLTLAGYGLAAVSKPLIGIAGVWGHMFAARLLDRVGKGLRGAPRDALIAENCTPDQRGRAYGLHRSLDTTGAVLGPLVGWAYLQRFPDQPRTLYLLAFVPALLGFLVLAFGVRERSAAPSARPTTPPRFSLASLSPTYRRYLAIVLLFGIGNSSDAFLLLRAQSAGLSTAQLLLVYALFNTVEAGLGYTVGRLSDRIGRVPLIAAGWGVFALVYLGFAWLPSPVFVWPLFVFYGLYSTLTQGAQKALAADLSHPDRRGTELGTFHLLVGIAALPASLIAGALYQRIAPAAPFIVGAFTATLAAALLLATRPKARA
jgi:MFS family permease